METALTVILIILLILFIFTVLPGIIVACAVTSKRRKMNKKIKESVNRVVKG